MPDRDIRCFLSKNDQLLYAKNNFECSSFDADFSWVDLGDRAEIRVEQGILGVDKSSLQQLTGGQWTTGQAKWDTSKQVDMLIVPLTEDTSWKQVNKLMRFFPKIMKAKSHICNTSQE